MFAPEYESPSICRLDVGGDTKAVFFTYVEGKDYAAVAEASHNMWCSRKQGRWGGGIANTEEDPCKVERSGLLGEMAFGIMFSCPVNLAYKPLGFDFDFEIGDFKVDVKTTLAESPNGIVLVRCEDARGNPVELISDIYVFGYIDHESRDNGYARVHLVGSMTREKILQYPTVAARRGDHRNKEIPYADLDSIVNFWEYAQSIK